jgi:hypothetical protein
VLEQCCDRMCCLPTSRPSARTVLLQNVLLADEGRRNWRTEETHVRNFYDSPPDVVRTLLYHGDLWVEYVARIIYK